jgi:hypothetical protein
MKCTFARDTQNGRECAFEQNDDEQSGTVHVQLEGVHRLGLYDCQSGNGQQCGDGECDQVEGGCVHAQITWWCAQESIAEYRVKMRQKFSILRFFLRTIANIVIVGLIVFSTFAISYYVDRSKNVRPSDGFLRNNEVPIVVSVITLVFPSLFEVIAMLERCA